jgi:hypothetical protein
MINKKDLETKIESLKLALKITIHEPTVQEAKQDLAYHVLLYKVKTGKNYNGLKDLR